jgi:N-methylhydantoinase B
MQVMWSRLIAIVEEQAQTILRTAFSPIVRESGDLSAGIFDPGGRLIAQAVTGTPGHINTMARSVGNFLEWIPSHELNTGDVLVTNDPWLGTGHLNDYVVVTPAFHLGRLIAFFACTGHMTDVGGIGLSPDASDTFAEGTAIPVMKLAESGVVNEALLAIAKANSRVPHELEGDLYSLMASNDVGVSRLLDLLSDVSEPDIEAISEFVIRQSRDAVLRKLASWPKRDSSHAMTVDGFEVSVTLRATVRVADDGISVDWSGTSPPSRFGINVPLNYAAAYSCYALSCALGDDIPNNAGTLSAFNVTAPSGCILNATRPQPVACRHIIGGLLPDVIFGCLDQLVPARVPAESASANWTLTLRSVGKLPFAISIVTNGGTGARPVADGLSATAFPSMVRGTPVEIVEASTPLVFWRRELREGSGGDGTYRGGLGQTMKIGTRSEEPFLFFAAFDRIDHPARGRHGGRPGASGTLAIGGGRRLPGKGTHVIEPNERLIVETPGGGGYGPPDRRSPELRAADRSAGYRRIE